MIRKSAYLSGIAASPHFSPPSPAAGAPTDYLLGHWKSLTTFLDDPFVPLHNNRTERALRGVVLGRKNHCKRPINPGSRDWAACGDLG